MNTTHTDSSNVLDADIKSPESKTLQGKFLTRKSIPVALAATLGLAAIGFFAMSSNGAAKPSISPDAAASRPAATVNNQTITEGELSSMISQGADRAVALDRYINKVLAAELARKQYSAESALALQGAEREVLSQLYVAKRSQDLRTGTTDAVVKAYYDNTIKADEFSTYKVKYFLAPDAKQADEVLAAAMSGKAADVASKFIPMKDEKIAGGFATGSELPYGLGQVVRQLKAGEYSRPIPLRNGIFVLNLVEVKTGVKPELSKIAENIKEVLVAQKLNDELAAARTSSTIQIR